MNDGLWVVEKDQLMVEGESITYSVDFIGATTVASPDTNWYLNGADYSATTLSGSASFSDSMVTCKTVTAQAGDGGIDLRNGGQFYGQWKSRNPEVPDPGGRPGR